MKKLGTLKSSRKYELQTDRINLWARRIWPSAASVTSTRCSPVNKLYSPDDRFLGNVFHTSEKCSPDMFAVRQRTIKANNRLKIIITQMTSRNLDLLLLLSFSVSFTIDLSNRAQPSLYLCFYSRICSVRSARRQVASPPGFFCK